MQKYEVKKSSFHECNMLKKSTWKEVQTANCLKLDLDYNIMVLFPPLEE